MIQLSPAPRLVEVALSELFPMEHEQNMFQYVERDVLLNKLAEQSILPVTVEDIAEYLNQVLNQDHHWVVGSGRRFLMKPLHTDRGESFDCCGPYVDTGTEGYEVGLWRVKTNKPNTPFPTVSRHPVQLRYSLLSSVVARLGDVE